MTVRIFIACSSAALPLARALKKVLSDKENYPSPVVWKVTAWWEEEQGLGRPLIVMLQDAGMQIDLAVTLLTGDDLKLTRGDNLLVPRDNCIFEAGLFMGALGLESERSILVSSVEEKAVPGDLKGVKYLPITGLTPELLTDDNWCLREMAKLAGALATHARTALTKPPKRPVLRVLSADELFEREKSVNEGGDLILGNTHSVVINTIQPAEENSISRARQVVENMTAGVTYLYFFRADPVHVPKVIGLLESLVIARFTKRASATPDERRMIIRNNAARIPEHLKALQQRLFIYFLPDNSAPLLFCVHNAGNLGRATCYLRDGAEERFYVWGNAETAFNVARDFQRYRKRYSDPAVFYPTSLYDLYSRDGLKLKSELEMSLRASFGRSDQIKKLCFLSKKSVRALRKRSGRVGRAVPAQLS